MKTFAFKSRLFVTYTAVVVAVVFLFSGVLIFTTTEMNRRTELYHQQELYKKNLGEVEAVLWQMDRLASQVVSNNEILASFIPLASDGDGSNYFDTNLLDSIRISSLLSSINGTDHYAARISVFNGSGDYVSTGTLYESPEIIAGVLGSDYYTEITGEVARRGGESLVTDFRIDTWSHNPNLRLISLYRTLSSYTSTAYGLVDIQVGADAFEDHSFWWQNGMEYFLVNRDGRVVYPFVELPQAEELFAQLHAEGGLAKDMPLVMETKLEGTDLIVMATRVLPSDWLFVRIMSSSALLAPYTGNIIIMAIACLALLCCLTLVMYYLSSRIAGPLQTLSAAIADVNLQNMQKSIRDTSEPYSATELEALRKSFHSMLLRLDTSVSMEIQAHMRALQSQMNPHFLFNMLSVIIESSEESGDARTVAMCLKLSAMLRYTADFNGDQASLAEEIEHTRNYLDLMKDRYEAMFTYEIVTEGDLDGILVPKMIIQPLAENCFTHGFRDCRPPWHIRVELLVQEGSWTLRVSDNGTGMTPETIEQVYAKAEAYRSDVATNYKNLRLGGMGLVNTLLRLSLTASGQIDFEIRNRPEGGTEIQIGGRLA